MHVCLDIHPMFLTLSLYMIMPFLLICMYFSLPSIHVHVCLSVCLCMNIHVSVCCLYMCEMQDNSAQNQLGPCQLGPHKNRPMPTRPKMQNSAHTNSAQFKFYKRQLVPHFRGIEVCVFYHLLTARFAPRIKYPYPFVHIEFYHG